MALVFTAQDLANAKAALVSGVLRVQLGDRLIIYRSQSEIIKLIELIENSLSGVSTNSSPNAVQASYSKNRKC